MSIQSLPVLPEITVVRAPEPERKPPQEAPWIQVYREAARQLFADHYPAFGAVVEANIRQMLARE